MTARRIDAPAPGTWRYFTRENRVFYQATTPEGDFSSVILAICYSDKTAGRVAELLTELHQYREQGHMVKP